MIKVSTKQATEFLALGYNVEHYIDLPFCEQTQKNKKIFHPKDTIFGLSMESKEPKKGKAGKYWIKLKNLFWSDDPLKTYTREQIEIELTKLGNTDISLFAYFANNVKCIRKIDS